MKNSPLELKAPWPEVKEIIMEANIELTDADLNYIPGREEELLAHLAGKMKRSREEIKAWIESVSSNKGKAS